MPNSTTAEPLPRADRGLPAAASGHRASPAVRGLTPTADLFGLLPAAYCLLLLLAGCPGSHSASKPQAPERPWAGVKLRLGVVDDPPLAAAAERLRGQWHTLTGAEFEVQTLTAGEIQQGAETRHDALICSDAELGVLAERGRVAPMPQDVLTRNAGEWSDLLELIQLRDSTWGTEVYAVPFGSPVLVCYYRADLLEKLGRQPPKTWAEYQELAELLSGRGTASHGEEANDSSQEDTVDAPTAASGDSRPWFGTIEPLGPGWAGLVLLARAAPYAKHRNNYSTLFNISTMEPLIDGPPFVRALEELVAAAELGGPDQLDYDPAAVRRAFWEGRCGMALTWPSAAQETPGPKGIKDVAKDSLVGFAELPGATEVYDVGKSAWNTRTEGEDPHVTLLGVAGRIGVVSSQAASREAAFQLLLWLSGSQYSPQVAAASPATTLFRRSQRDSPQRWTEEPIGAGAAHGYAEAVQAALQRQQWLYALRIPGRSEYLAALDEAVGQAVRGEKPPADALKETATRWREITARLGEEKQKSSYLKSLGL